MQSERHPTLTFRQTVGPRLRVAAELFLRIAATLLMACVHPLHVTAGAERAAGSGQHDDVHVRIVRKDGERDVEAVVHRVRQRVASIRALKVITPTLPSMWASRSSVPVSIFVIAPVSHRPGTGPEPDDRYGRGMGHDAMGPR